MATTLNLDEFKYEYIFSFREFNIIKLIKCVSISFLLKTVYIIYICRIRKMKTVLKSSKLV